MGEIKATISEERLQYLIWTRAWNDYPESRRCMWAVPNGGSRNMVEATKLKATGTLPGVFDLHLIWQGKFYAFELKVGSNKLSDKQNEWAASVNLQGAATYTIRTEDEFFEVFDKIIRPAAV